MLLFEIAFHCTTKEKEAKADEEAEAASKNTVIKVLMGEVQVFTQLRLSST